MIPQLEMGYPSLNYSELVEFLKISNTAGCTLEKWADPDQQRLLDVINRYVNRTILGGFFENPKEEVGYLSGVTEGTITCYPNKLTVPGNAILNLDPRTGDPVLVAPGLNSNSLIEAWKTFGRTGDPNVITLLETSLVTQRQMVAIKDNKLMRIIIDTVSPYHGQGDEVVNKFREMAIEQNEYISKVKKTQRVEAGQPYPFMNITEHSELGIVITVPWGFFNDSTILAAGKDVKVPFARYSGPLSIPGMAILLGATPINTHLDVTNVRGFLRYMRAILMICDGQLKEMSLGKSDQKLTSQEDLVARYRSLLVRNATHLSDNLAKNLLTIDRALKDYYQAANSGEMYGMSLTPEREEELMQQIRKLQEVKVNSIDRIVKINEQINDYVSKDLSMHHFDLIPVITSALNQTKNEYAKTLEITTDFPEELDDFIGFGIPGVIEGLIDNAVSNVNKIWNADNSSNKPEKAKLLVKLSSHITSNGQEFALLTFEDEGPGFSDKFYADLLNGEIETIESDLDGHHIGLKTQKALIELPASGIPNNFVAENYHEGGRKGGRLSVAIPLSRRHSFISQV